MSTPSNASAWSKLSQRERTYVGALAVNFVLITLALGVYFYQKYETTTQLQINNSQSALNKLAEVGPDFLARKAAAAKVDPATQRFSPEKLKSNDLKLTSFVATHASATNIKVDNYDEKSVILSSGKDGGPQITKKIVRLTIREAKMADLLRMLDRIEKDRQPVVIERINLREVRRKPGYVRANVSVVTYIQKDAES